MIKPFARLTPGDLRMNRPRIQPSVLWGTVKNAGVERSEVIPVRGDRRNKQKLRYLSDGMFLLTEPSRGRAHDAGGNISEHKS